MSGGAGYILIESFPCVTLKGVGLTDEQEE
jgi:hypothetical protein